MKTLRCAGQGFALAFSMLTILPGFRIHTFTPGLGGCAAMSYPVVGAVLGALLWGLAAVLEPFFPAAHLHLLLFGAWVLLTGALHLDGFSDSVDAFFVPVRRAEAVMKDPHVGAMGMVFTALFLLLKASSLLWLDALWLLPAILALSRFNAAAAIYFFPYVRAEGMSSAAKKEMTAPMLAVAAAFTAAVLFATPGSAIPAAVSLLTLALVSRLVMRRYGGYSGDLYGFLIETTELALLNAAVAAGTP